MARPGITLLELTVVLVVLLSLVGITMIGTHAWRRGSDRAGCVMNLRNVQTSVRAYQNTYGYQPGTYPYAQSGTQSIAEHLLDKGYIDTDLYSQIKGSASCPGGGTYSIDREDVFPAPGDLYAHCSLGDERLHAPTDDRGW